MYPKARIDALTDGIFAVAMTILVLDLRLPDDLHPVSSDALLAAVRGLWPKLFPYLLSFYVLGTSWLSNIRLRSREEFVGRRYASSWLLHLMLATCLPFSTTVVGRFAHYGPAVWLYAGNMAALAAVGYRLVVLLPALQDDANVRDRKLSLLLIIGTSALCVALTAIRPEKALWAYVLNFGAPVWAWWREQRVPGKGADGNDRGGGSRY
jgi:TMEM175 potassium channel family protein